MFKLNTNINYTLESYSLPSDDGIHLILDSFFNNLSTTNNDSARLKLLLENVKITIPDCLDYRKPNIYKSVCKYKKCLKEMKCSSELKKPFISVLEYVVSFTKKYKDKQTSNPISTSENKYIHDLEIMDIAMVLNKYGYITIEAMEKYVSENRENVLRSVCEITSTRRMTLSRNESKPCVTTNPICITESYPNDIFIDNIFDSICRESIEFDDKEIYISDDEVGTLVEDFINDESISDSGCNMSIVVNILRSFVSGTYNGKIDIKEFINDAYDVKSAYIISHTLILHYTLKLIVIIITMMQRKFELWRQNPELIQLKNSIITDIEDYQDMGVVSNQTTDNVYANITSIWKTSDMLRNVQSARTQLGGDVLGEVILGESTNLLKTESDDNVEGVAHFSNGKPVSLKPIRDIIESFDILQDGTIKVVLDKNTTYMNEYMSNHRLLLANKDLGNYEGMKYNLVYNLILIDSIEKKVLYNKRIKKSSNVYEDAEKARRFAKNDIKTYLPELRVYQNDFDLNKFYSQVKADKNTINIDTVNTVRGVKMIINSILY